MKYIGVIGGSQASAEILTLAGEVGREIARSGSVLVCGGLGGVMEAAARGAREEGGLTLGILPSGCRSDANPWIDIAVATNLGHARNAIIAQTADVLIAIDGRYGTLSEIGHALALGKRVIGLRTWDCGCPIVKAEAAAEAVRRALES
jgi:hypothetical protein